MCQLKDLILTLFDLIFRRIYIYLSILKYYYLSKIVLIDGFTTETKEFHQLKIQPHAI